jgi:hypothetical protein
MKKHKHYATRYKERIFQLEKAVRMYYMANYNAKRLVGHNPGIIGVMTIQGDEEVPVIRDAEGLKQVILDLPLKDFGC